MQEFFYPDGFKDLVPDSFICPNRCNTCKFSIEKYDTYYTIDGGMCTMRACPGKDYPPEEKLCFTNWMLSKHITYNRFPSFVNNYIHGYRNFFYIKEIQETIDKNFNPRSSLTEEHTRIALSQGIKFGSQFYELLLKKGRFLKDDLEYCSIYFRNPGYLPDRTQYRNGKYFDTISILQDIFDYLRFNLFLEEIDHSIAYAMINVETRNFASLLGLNI